MIQWFQKNKEVITFIMVFICIGILIFICQRNSHESFSVGAASPGTAAAGSPGGPGRRLQDGNEDDVGELVHIIKRSETTRRPGSAGTDEADGGGVHLF